MGGTTRDRRDNRRDNRLFFLLCLVCPAKTQVVLHEGGQQFVPLILTCCFVLFAAHARSPQKKVALSCRSDSTYECGTGFCPSERLQAMFRDKVQQYFDRYEELGKKML